MTRYQRGIFYKKKPVTPLDFRGGSSSNSTFAILFLSTAIGSSAYEIEKSLEKLWKMYTSLLNGQMSVLIGYGPNIFKLNGVKRAIPENLNRQFLPSSNESRDILDGCAIKYSNDTKDNLGLREDIMIQIISNTQLATYNAIAETFKHFGLNDKENTLKLSTFYTGFQRDDGRSWLGFQDEISNLSSERERRKTVLINAAANDLRLRDYWTHGGTYLAFIRIEINILRWELVDPIQQEFIVGRRKKDGMPLIGVDKKGRPQTVDRFKQKITTRMIRDHPDYFRIRHLSSDILRKLDVNASLRILTQSHVGRTRHMESKGGDKAFSRRIYRQSFEFIEPLYKPEKPMRLGTNFISFQNDPGRLFFILTDPNWMGGSNFGGESGKSEISDLLSVLAAGVFYVPPMEKPFPGKSIFA
jgi:deferrochelatase/peroxidase EfeB